MQAQLSALHLYPLGEQFVDAHDFLGQLTHVAQPLGLHFSLLTHVLHLSPHAVEIGHDGIYERHFGPSFQIALHQFAGMELCCLAFLLQFLEPLLPLRGTFVLGGHSLKVFFRAAHIVQTLESHARVALQAAGVEGKHAHHQYHQEREQKQLTVDCMHLLGQDVAAGIQFAVLARLVEEVQVGVAMQVRQLLVIERTVGQAQLLMYVGHPRLHGGGVAQLLFLHHRECSLEVGERPLGSPLDEVDFSQRAVGTGGLIQVLVVAEERPGLFGHKQGQPGGGQGAAVGREARDQITVTLGFACAQQSGLHAVGQHRGKRLQAVGLEVDTARGVCCGIGAQQVVKLRLRHIGGISGNQSAASQHIVIINPLRSVALERHFCVYAVYFGTGSGILSQIIIIGGGYDVEFGERIMEALLLPGGQAVPFLEDARNAPQGMVAVAEE